MKKISPCLWFDGGAEAAAKLYENAFGTHFKKGKVHMYQTETPSHKPVGSVMMVEFEIYDQNFTALNGGPAFTPNPSISFHIKYTDVEQLEAAWAKLADGGKVMMPLDEYPFSKKFGWVEDKFGISWQLIHIPEDVDQRVTIAFLFTKDSNGKAEEAIDHYLATFEKGKIISKQHTPDKKYLQYGSFELFGQEFGATDGGDAPHEFAFSEGVSLMVSCKDQEEVDKYWNALSAVLESEQCGWLKDKYGVSWQIVPVQLEGLLGDPEKGKKVMEAFMEMKKIDIAKLQSIK